MERRLRLRIEQGLAVLAVGALLACGTDGNSPGGAEAGATDDRAAAESGEESGADATTNGADGRAGADGGGIDAGGDRGTNVMDGGIGDAASGPADASVMDATGGGDDGGLDASGDALLADGADALADGGSGDTATDDGAASDGGLPDAPAEAGCVLSTGPAISCGGLNNCGGATNYCLAGSLPNTCKAIPPECVCADSHDCACLLAHIASPCDGGTVTCTAYADGGQLWIFASNCH
jgi:hypothetical protein